MHLLNPAEYQPHGWCPVNIRCVNVGCWGNLCPLYPWLWRSEYQSTRLASKWRAGASESLSTKPGVNKPSPQASRTSDLLCTVLELRMVFTVLKSRKKIEMVCVSQSLQHLPSSLYRKSLPVPDKQAPLPFPLAELQEQLAPWAHSPLWGSKEEETKLH